MLNLRLQVAQYPQLPFERPVQQGQRQELRQVQRTWKRLWQTANPSETSEEATALERKARATPRRALGSVDFGLKNFPVAFETTMVDPI